MPPSLGVPEGATRPQAPSQAATSTPIIWQRACHSPSQPPLPFPSRAKAKFGPTGSWGSGGTAPAADLPSPWPSSPPFPVPEVTEVFRASPSPTAAPLLPEDHEKWLEQRRCAHSGGDTTYFLCKRTGVGERTWSLRNQNKAHSHAQWDPHPLPTPTRAKLGCGFLDPPAPPVPSSLNLATL